MWPMRTSCTDALVWLGFLTETEADACENWKDWLIELTQSRRAALVTAQECVFWIPAERLRQLQAVHPVGVVDPPIAAPASADEAWEQDAALIELVPWPARRPRPDDFLAQLIETFGLPPARISAALTALEVEGFALADIHAGRNRTRMVRAAATRAHPPLYGEANPRRDRARLRARLSPLLARLAGRFDRCAARRREGA